MLSTMETADIFLSILYNKSCFLCYKMSSNMINIAEILEIHEPYSNKVLYLSDIVHYLFPSYSMYPNFGETFLNVQTRWVDTLVVDDPGCYNYKHIGWLPLWDRLEHIFDLLQNITCSQACRDCSDLLIRMYVSMIKNNFIRNIVNTFTNKFKRYIKESNVENDLKVNLTIQSKEDKNQINENSTTTRDINTQIDNVIESRTLDKPLYTEKSLPQIRHTKKRKKKYYNCNDCSYRSLCKGTLEGHMNKHHIKARPFVCDICYKSFYTKSNLTEHSQTHNKVGEICDVCGDVFGRRRSLVDHLRLHTNDRQYKCDICDKYFVNSGRRLDHMKRNHLEKVECCVFCDKRFAMKKELIRHVKSVHT